MKPSELKPSVLEAVKRAADKHSAVKFKQVYNAMPLSLGFQSRDLDRALQLLRREKAIVYIPARDPSGKRRTKWGWQPVAAPVSKKAARR